MDVASLGYLRITAEDPHNWAGFASHVLGMETVPGDGDMLHLRMDERHHRIAIEPAEPSGNGSGNGSAHDVGGGCYGWEVADAAALDVAAGELEASGVVVTAGSKAELENRRVAGMVHCLDPAGHRVELFCGADRGDGEFTPGRDISGFKTGALGLGHVVLMVPELEPAARFYQDVLGFRLSDYMLAPFKAMFLHTNPRHHSLALLEVGVSALHHFMVELDDVDDVGRGYDLVQAEGIPVARTLGRHTNDRMISFYARTPSGFEVEYGWGGYLIDDAGWEPCELSATSSWGHTLT
jgi:3,4-dihydroxy-9,10-secoandrosta-1,3,5(10)-triene-9,17-dione 4,5-dioxygenase